MMCWRSDVAVLLVVHGEVDERLEVALEVADVVAFLVAGEPHRVDGRPWLTSIWIESVICSSPPFWGTVLSMASKISGPNT